MQIHLMVLSPCPLDSVAPSLYLPYTLSLFYLLLISGSLWGLYPSSPTGSGALASLAQPLVLLLQH